MNTKLGGEVESKMTEAVKNSNADVPYKERKTPDQVKETIFIPLKPIHSNLEFTVVNIYVSQLAKKNNLRRDSNRYGKHLELDDQMVDELIFSYFKEKKTVNPLNSCIEAKREQFIRNVKALNLHRVTIYNYKALGSSARINPAYYGTTLNSMNSVVKTYMFKHIGKYLYETHNMARL